MCSEHKYFTFIRTASKDTWSLTKEKHACVMRGENLDLILHKSHIFDLMSDTFASGTTTALHMARVGQPVGEQCETSDNESGLGREDLSHLVPLGQVPPCGHGS